MSSGLEALHHPRIKSAKVDISAEGKHDIAYMFFDDTKQYAAIEKELKALEIIKDKRVNCFDVIDSVDYEHYLVLMEEYHKSWRLTKKEYDLLKEVLL